MLAADHLAPAAEWATTVTAVVVIVGAVVAWFSRISHGLHISGQGCALHVTGCPPNEVGVAPWVEFTNTKSIPLRFQVERFVVTVNDTPLDDVNPALVKAQYVAPGQDNRTWTRDLAYVPDTFPLKIEVSYTFAYGRSQRLLWPLRRRITGSTRFVVPFKPGVGQRVEMMSEDMDGPPRDHAILPRSKHWKGTKRTVAL